MLPATAEALKREANTIAKRTVADFADDADALKLMGDTHIRLGNSAEAIKWWNRCLELSPDRADIYSDMALVAWQKQELDQAVQLWRKVLEIEPRAVGVCNSLARALMDQGKPNEAIVVQKQAMQTSGESAKAHSLLGQGHLQLKEYELARQHFEKAIALDTGQTRAYYGLATTYTRLGDYETAKKHRETFRHRKAAELERVRENKDPLADLATVRRHVAQVYFLSGRIYGKHGDIARAEQLWQEGVAIDAGNGPCLLELAKVYRSRRQWSASRLVYEKLAELEPQNVHHQIQLGVVCAQLGEFAAAEKAFQRVVEMTPDRAWGYMGLARLYAQANRKLDQAKTHAQTAVRLEPTAESYRLLGDVCKKSRDAVGARAAMRQAAELSTIVHE